MFLKVCNQMDEEVQSLLFDQEDWISSRQHSDPISGAVRHNGSE